MDTPELMIDLYYDSGYKLSKETVEKIQLRGLEYLRKVRMAEKR